MKQGILYGLGAYLIWGFMPIWLKQIKSIPAIQILGHRIVWSLILLAIIITFRRQWKIFFKSAKSYRTIQIYFVAAIFLAMNWLTYIYAVNSNHIVESSLGYFINPLVNVLFGLIFFKERLRSWQWLPVAIASIGVVYLTLDYGRLPWIALALAFTFAFYAVVKKAAPLGALYGLTLETAILVIPAGLLLVFLGLNGNGSFGRTGTYQDIMLVFAGFITAVPLLLFGSAARAIPLSMLGLLQYVAPSCQFLIGVILYREPFTLVRLTGFAIVWVALILFTAEGLIYSLKINKAPILN